LAEDLFGLRAGCSFHRLAGEEEAELWIRGEDRG